MAFLQTPLRALDIVDPLDRTGGLPRGALIEVSLQEPAYQLLAPSVQLPLSSLSLICWASRDER